MSPPIKKQRYTRRDAIKIGKINFPFYCRYFFPEMFRKPFNTHHKKIIKVLYLGGHQYIIILAPRGLGKTTLIKAFISHQIVYKKIKFLMYISKSAKVAIQQTEHVKMMLCMNEKIVDCFGDPFAKNKMPGINRLTNIGKEFYGVYGAWVLPRGANQQVRGVLAGPDRPDLILYDDLADKTKYTISPDYGKKLSKWFYSDPLYCHEAGNPNYRHVYIDTCKSPFGLESALMADPTWEGVRIEAFDDDYKTTDPGFLTQEYVDMLHERARNANKLPELILEYRAKHAQIHRKVIFRYAIDHGAYCQMCMRDQFGHVLPEIGNNISYELGETFVIVDPARDDAEDNNKSGFAVVSFMEHLNKIIIRKTFADHYDPESIYDTAFDLCARYNARYLGIEITGLEKFVSQPIMNRITRENLPLEYIPLQASGGRSAQAKYARFKEVLPLYKQGLIIHIKDECNAYETHVSELPYPSEWDILDCISYLNQLSLKANLLMTPLFGNDGVAQQEPDWKYLEQIYDQLDQQAAVMIQQHTHGSIYQTPLGGSVSGSCGGIF